MLLRPPDWSSRALAVLLVSMFVLGAILKVTSEPDWYVFLAAAIVAGGAAFFAWADARGGPAILSLVAFFVAALWLMSLIQVRIARDHAEEVKEG